jgi:glyoxylase-like metal-dependent hydrolase (beta-lactamase superfamily II)
MVSVANGIRGTLRSLFLAVTRTGGHTPGHSVVRLASGGDRLTFAGDAVFQVGFEHPD